MFVQATELQKVKRRFRNVRATRRNTELEGTRSTAATRADQNDYARGKITAAELGERVRQVQHPVTGVECRIHGTPAITNGIGRATSSPLCPS